jgi:uncharacterized protein YdhG (YjbR/CyaY superfamily)
MAAQKTRAGATKPKAKPKRVSKAHAASSSPKGPPKTIDELIARAAPEQRAALETLRGQLRALVPGAEECISYGQAGLRVGGKAVLWFGAAKKHLSLFPGAVVESFAKELRGFDISKGTIRFQPGRPLPGPLLRKIVKAGVAAHTRPKQ